MPNKELAGARPTITMKFLLLVISIGRRMSGASSDAVGCSHASLHKSFVLYREHSQPKLHRNIADGLVQ